jgi:hypothetical protein
MTMPAIVADPLRIPCLRAIFSAAEQGQRRVTHAAIAGDEDTAVGSEV